MNTTLLLTSCVNVQYKSGQSAQERIRQYVEAIHFYYDDTDFDIVFCDNSSYDISNDLPKTIIDSDRIEILFYQCTEICKKGKGYNEAGIIEYAMANSEFLKSSDIIIKITGRHIISNINKICENVCLSNKTVYVDVDVNLSYAHSYFFIAPPIFFEKYFLPYKGYMNDSEGVHFEHVLAESLKRWISADCSVATFKYPIYIIGTQGSNNVKYNPPSFKRYVLIYIKHLIFKLKLYKR